MVLSSKISLAAIFIVVAAFAAYAQDIHLPKIDLQKLCKENNAAVTAVFSDVSKDAISTCVDDEQAARAQIVKEWASYPAVARSRCIQPGEFYPGYTEWLSCLQMTRDALQLRKETTVGSSYGNRQCPIVRVTPNGDLRSVVAC
jgi:hypothetical protein